MLAACGLGTEAADPDPIRTNNWHCFWGWFLMPDETTPAQPQQPVRRAPRRAVPRLPCATEEGRAHKPGGSRFYHLYMSLELGSVPGPTANTAVFQVFVTTVNWAVG
jgi:hypothetical protein